jgi:phospholipid/cholesterol/gamma-HCH transport system substrate-binding protein
MRASFRLRIALTAVVASLAASACTGNGVYDINLPGGADLGSHPYTVTAQFRDVLDLVRQASVKVDDVSVGQVDGISLGPGGKSAVVKLELNGDVKLPANATASIEQTSLLGEKYVSLSRPANPTGTLRNGDTIPLSATSQAVDIEQVFGALSLLLNGGGVGQLHDIVVELRKAVGGDNGASVRELLDNADVVIRKIDTHRSDIITALHEVNDLAQTLDQNRRNISDALRDLPAGLKVLASQRHQLVHLIDGLNRLSTATVHTVRASQHDFVADLQALTPVLRQLTAAGSALPKSLQILLTYPFPDSVLRAIKGDYLNSFIIQNLNTPGGNVVHTHVQDTHSAPSLLPTSGSGGGR